MRNTRIYQLKSNVFSLKINSYAGNLPIWKNFQHNIDFFPTNQSIGLKIMDKCNLASEKRFHQIQFTTQNNETKESCEFSIQKSHEMNHAKKIWSRINILQITRKKN